MRAATRSAYGASISLLVMHGIAGAACAETNNAEASTATNADVSSRGEEATASAGTDGTTTSTTRSTSDASGQGDGSEASTGTPSPCEEPDYQCSLAVDCVASLFDSCGDVEPTGSGGDLGCVLSALQNGGVGAVEINMEIAAAPEDHCNWTDSITLLGDGTAVFRRVRGDQFGRAAYFRRVRVKPPEFFAPCIGSDDLPTLQTCLAEWFIEDSCEAGVCCPAGAESGNTQACP
jgi:hypothetical protein